ncbi:hypothetical protein OU995_08295 [Roseateles sp. SL47]|uniref:hypothetical protein n=1 Tax=Roseateles sp. SL47 TaxID=2995138 RepID=UPI00226E2C49|nr:hypothetical protein [Roseateles sp. SL47]WAC74686.1 hypothetical protein OU995_08295 [Roseateles sp. SL47]
MTSSQLPRKLFNWAVILFFAVLLLIFAGAVALYYTGFRVKEAPTCANFRASVPAERANKVLPDLQSVIEAAGLKLKPEVQRDTYARWESDRAKVSYYANRESKDSSLFVCSNNSDPKLWQEVAVKMEQVLQRDAITVKAWLQLNDNDFKCNPNCVIDVPMPLDFEKLNRTLLVPKGS